MNPQAIAEELPVLPLGFRGVEQPGKPREGDDDTPTVSEVNAKVVFIHRHIDGSGVGARRRSRHSTFSGRGLGALELPYRAYGLVAPESHRRAEVHGTEPELGKATPTLHMDVRRFRVLVAVEEEPVWANAKDRGHRGLFYSHGGSNYRLLPLRVGPQPFMCLDLPVWTGVVKYCRTPGPNMRMPMTSA